MFACSEELCFFAKLFFLRGGGSSEIICRGKCFCVASNIRGSVRLVISQARNKAVELGSRPMPPRLRASLAALESSPIERRMNAILPEESVAN